MPLTIVLAGQKGGVGKSTVAVCLAAEAVRRSMKVLLVDADPQGTARTWAEVATEAGRPAPSIVAMGATMHRDRQLSDIGEPFDLVLIDCPPRLGDIQRSALMVADIVILPCGPAAAEAWALASSLELVTDARGVRPELAAYILITRTQRRTSIAKSAREVLEPSGLPVLQTELGYRVAYQEALATGQGVTTYAARDPAAAEVKALLDEVLVIAKKSHGKNHPQAAAKKTPRAASRRSA
jgi:chromosome partitioning protein